MSEELVASNPGSPGALIELDSILETRGLTRSFGGLTALSDVSLAIARGSITALIGPNGAGKTTLFNCLTGVYAPSAGLILLRPTPGPSLALNGRPPHEIVNLGLARTFQNIRLFNNLTVLENVLIGCHTRLKARVWGAVFRTRATRAEEAWALERGYSLLKDYGLADQASNLAQNLPYGAQRRLEIIRAVATQPQVLLLDEPAAGLNIGETEELKELLHLTQAREKLTIVLIEHDMSLVMSVSHWIHALEYGRLIASGTPEAIQKAPEVIRAYLGEG
jgi:branched-chain amino acid transport system ATP-binding protein